MSLISLHAYYILFPCLHDLHSEVTWPSQWSTVMEHNYATIAGPLHRVKEYGVTSAPYNMKLRIKCCITSLSSVLSTATDLLWKVANPSMSFLPKYSQAAIHQVFLLPKFYTIQYDDTVTSMYLITCNNMTHTCTMNTCCSGVLLAK